MAALPVSPVLSVEEYLHTAYRPDREYVDGVLVERQAGTVPHSRLQRILLGHFARLPELSMEALPECRTRITASRFRVPDVMVARTPFDTAARDYEGVPLAIIEILSPDDKMPDGLERFEEYQTLGVPSIIQMDPVKRVTRVFESSNLIRRELSMLALGNHNIPFETAALYALLG